MKIFRFRRRRLGIILAGSVVALAGLSSLVAFAMAQSDESPSEAVVTRAAPTGEQVASIPATFSSLLAPTSAGTLPALAATEMRAIAPKNVELERSVLAIERDGMSVYLTPAGDVTCISLLESGGATVNCLPNATIASEDGGPASMHRGCREVENRAVCDSVVLYGPAPDGITNVTVDVKRGTPPSTEVTNNAYLIHVSNDQQPHGLALEANNTFVKQTFGR